jgi:hypothetical protein
MNQEQRAELLKIIYRLEEIIASASSQVTFKLPPASTILEDIAHSVLELERLVKK